MRLGVNIDHVATLRQARRGRYPDPVAAAALCELGGAEQITLHVREDRRHVNDRDLSLLKQTVNGTLNLEMAATEAMVALAVLEKPHTVTLVPEKREELTTEGGLDVIRGRAQVAAAVKALRGGGHRGLALHRSRLEADRREQAPRGRRGRAAHRELLRGEDQGGARGGAQAARARARPLRPRRVCGSRPGTGSTTGTSSRSSKLPKLPN